jgi:tetratricopeptide (TPR) repeat protein
MAVMLGMASETEMRAARALMYDGLEMSRSLGEEALTAEVLTDLAWTADYMGEPAEAAPCAEEALRIGRTLGSQWLLGLALGPLALVARTRDEKRALWQEALACLRRAGDLVMCVFQILPLAVLEIEDGHLDAACTLYQEALALSEDTRSPITLYLSLDGLGEARLLQGEIEQAANCCRRSVVGLRRLGSRSDAAMAFFKLACCATRLGHFLEAACLAGACDVMHAAYVIEAGPEGAYKWNKWTALHQRLWDENLAQLRDALGNHEFDTSYSAGSRLTFDEAVDLALSTAK